MPLEGFLRPAFKYSHQAGAVATTQLKSGPGTLRAVTFNSTGAAPGVVTLADNVVPNTTNPIAIITPAGSSTPSTYEYDAVFNNGLTYTNIGGTNADVTVSFI